MYHQVEIITRVFPHMQLSEVKGISVRERNHWYNRAVAILEAQLSAPESE